ncbi:MAG TPA: transposase [Chloroflexota bacterium]|nr:transposase [Chloroflexota bacterium]
MSAAYADLVRFVQSLAPTWRKTQHEGFAHLLGGLLERPTLCPTELARAWPRPDQPLHGRLKRLTRLLANPRLDELAFAVRWLKLSYHFSADAPTLADGRPLLPVLVDTTYFEPFACLLASVPCGSRGLPIALTTYHRTTLEACFPPEATWPTPHTPLVAPGRRHPRPAPAAAVVARWPSQNRIEEQLLRLVTHLVSPALRPVVVADRGFARAELFRDWQAQQQDFVIRIDADTHVQVNPFAVPRPAAEALACPPGERRWRPQGTYQATERVPVHLLAVHDVGQAEPWYLATTLADPDASERLYRWRLRLECTNRDCKTGVLLREGDDHHALTQPLHLHRLLLALAAAEWLCAFAGLQAWRDLPAAEQADAPGTAAPVPGPDAPVRVTPPPAPDEPLPAVLDRALPHAPPTPELLAWGPALPPPVLPHRGPTPPLPRWLRRFAVRGWLSYVRLGLEVLRAPDLGWLLRRAVGWLHWYLWPSTPLWRPWQQRYRRLHWWPDAA